MKQREANEQVSREFSWFHIQNQTSTVSRTDEYILGTLDVLAPRYSVRKWLKALAHNAAQIGRRISLRPIGKNKVHYNRMIDRTPAQVLVVVRRPAEVKAVR